MVVIDERMAQFWGCKPQTYGDWSDPTGGAVGRRHIHFLHHVLQKKLNVGQCEGGPRYSIVLEYFLISSGNAERITMRNVCWSLVFAPFFFLGEICLRCVFALQSVQPSLAN